MRGPPLVVLAACAAGCFFQPMEPPQADSTASTASTGPADPATTAPTSDTGLVCEPGSPAPCPCPDGVGVQLCGPFGQGYGACECPDDPTTTTGTTTTTTTTGDLDTGTSTTTGTTAAVDTSTTDSSTTLDTTTGGSTTGDSTTGEMGCMTVDPEPNDTPENAAVHLEIECMGEPSNFTGVLDGDLDVDWHTYHGSWLQACPSAIDPPMIHTVTASGSLRVCVFPSCDAMDFMEDIVCGDDTTPEMDMLAGAGCCGAGDVDFEFDCEGSANESAQVLIRVDEAPADSCVSYAIEYAYD